MIEDARRGVAIAVALCVAAAAGFVLQAGQVTTAPPPTVIPLWPEGVPGVKPDAGPERDVEGRVSNVHAPTLLYYPAAESTTARTAIIVCPGGSYARLALANEAAAVTSRLLPAGVTVFVLKYRLGEYGQPAPLQDVLRAIRTVRSRAAAFGVDADRIGVFGASAGGHVALSAATMFDAVAGRTGVALDATSARPDFVALLYPVVTMRNPDAHAESRRNLLGPSPATALIDQWSMETRIRSDMPPVFLVHTAEDTSVPLEHSVLLQSAMRKNHVGAEVHFYERGAHGFGGAPGLGTTSGWVDRLTEWLRAHGWASGSAQSAAVPSIY